MRRETALGFVSSYVILANVYPQINLFFQGRSSNRFANEAKGRHVHSKNITSSSTIRNKSIIGNQTTNNNEQSDFSSANK